MRAILLSASAFLLAGPALAAEPVAVEFRCLTTGGAKPVRLEWRTFSEPASGWSSAYVKYKGSKQVIPLVLRSSEVTDRPDNRPWAFTSTWLEVVDGKISGEYRIASQGANIEEFVYKSHRTGKEIPFSQDNEAFEEAGCTWK